MLKMIKRVAVGAAAFVGSAAVYAADGVDVSAATSAIAGAAAPIAAVGGAILAAHVGIKVYKLVRAAL